LYDAAMVNKTLACVGLGICVLSAAVMVGNVVSIAWGSALGVIGIGLLAASAAKSSGSAEQIDD
jgi:hypothetical protein